MSIIYVFKTAISGSRSKLTQRKWYQSVSLCCKKRNNYLPLN